MRSLYELIEQRHPPNEWAVFPELPSNTGGIRNRVDAAAFNCWKSKKMLRIAYEFKRTRSDFLSELRKPRKREFCEEYFHETWFVFEEKKVGTAEEVPDGWGLLVRTKKGDQLRSRKVARHREPKPMSEEMMLAVLRRAANEINQHRFRSFEFEGDEITLDQLKGKVAKMLYADQQELMRQTAQATQERHELREMRRTLTAPLERLVMRATNKTWGLEGMVKDATPQLVDTWFDQALANASQVIASKINGAYGQVSSALDAIRDLQDQVEQTRRESTNAELSRSSKRDHRRRRAS